MMKRLAGVILSIAAMSSVVATASADPSADDVNVPPIPGLHYDAKLEYISPTNPSNGAKLQMFINSPIRGNLRIVFRVYGEESVPILQGSSTCNDSVSCKWPKEGGWWYFNEPGLYCVLADFYYPTMAAQAQSTVFKSIEVP